MCVWVVAVFIGMDDNIQHLLSRKRIREKAGKFVLPLVAIADLYRGCIYSRAVGFVANGSDPGVGRVLPSGARVKPDRLAAAIDFPGKDVPLVDVGVGFGPFWVVRFTMTLAG